MLLMTLFALNGFIMMSRFMNRHGDLSAWWGLPIWLGYFVGTALLFIVLVAVLILLLPKRDPSPGRRDGCHHLVSRILSFVLLILGYRVHTEGLSCLPRRSYLLVCNHQSAFDPLCTIGAFPNSALAFVAKPSVFKIPIIGTILHRMCFLPIDRENARNAVTTIKRAAELIRDVGLSMGIYPEGTRSKDGTLLPFHAGSFKIAKLAECPLVVTTIRYEKSKLLPWMKLVHLHVVDVMSEEIVKENNTAALSERAEQAIRNDLGM